MIFTTMLPFPTISISAQDRIFYEQKGYLIVKGILNPTQVSLALEAQSTIRQKFSAESKLTPELYEREINQIRDLWKQHPFYRQCLLESAIPQIAAQLFQQSGATLLHDHIIQKPRSHSEEVPWHQDYPYWPVDTPQALSVWVALDDLDTDAGVLEVVSGSHLLGERAAVDFMQGSQLPTFLKDSAIVPLIVERGDAVILHALTWHRSCPNTSIPNRRAYISLWLPPNAHYTPQHAPWHPINQNVSVEPGQPLNSDWFPTVPAHHDIELMTNTERSTRQHEEGDYASWSMFNASKVVNRLLEQALQTMTRPIPLNKLPPYLLVPEQRQDFANKLFQQQAINGNLEALESALEEWAVHQIAYHHHQGRNVYNKSYVKLKILLTPSS